MRPSITFKLTLARRSPTHRPKEPLRIMDEDGHTQQRRRRHGTQFVRCNKIKLKFETTKAAATLKHSFKVTMRGQGTEKWVARIQWEAVRIYLYTYKYV